MPLFEFICTNCDQPFEELVSSANAIDEVICPFCSSPNISKKISLFASKASGDSSFSFNSAPSTACGPAST